ncbi:hypothetical protein GH733_000491 [Mirounga leonina]|nr:hypothetical protein GH733_000491 [Mirounga leonina]
MDSAEGKTDFGVLRPNICIVDLTLCEGECAVHPPRSSPGYQQYEGLSNMRKSLVHPNAGTTSLKATLVIANPRRVDVEGQASGQLRVRSEASE